MDEDETQLPSSTFNYENSEHKIFINRHPAGAVGCEPLTDNQRACVDGKGASVQSSEQVAVQLVHSSSADLFTQHESPSTMTKSELARESSTPSSLQSSAYSCDWKKGDRCLAPYEEDGQLYEAEVERIRCRRRQQPMAEITFIGFEEDGRVLVPAADLRPLQDGEVDTKDYLFGHLDQQDEKDRHLREKYGDWHGPCESLGVEEIEVDASLNIRQKTKARTKGKGANQMEAKGISSSGKDAQRRASSKEKVNEKGKLVVAFGGHSTSSVHCPPSLVAGAMKESKVTSPRPSSRPSTDPAPAATPSAWTTPDGFSEDDLEKPHFRKIPSSKKEPFRLSSSDEPLVEIPAPLNQYLRSYQREGVQFFYDHFVKDEGCLLGDDMGLGKTVQVIAFVAAVLGKTNTHIDVLPRFQQRVKRKLPYHGVFLIVTPLSVLYNWLDELQTWGHFKTRILHGNQCQETMDAVRRQNIDVVLTTYETAKLKLDFINSIVWLAGVFDEAHRLKDPKTQTTIYMKQLRLSRRIGLTGTAMQNRLTELWCLLDWCNAGCLGSKEEFEEGTALPIMTGQRLDSTKRELATSRKKQKELHQQLNKWFLRRTKALIADQLPKKEECILFCPWTPIQFEICKAMLESDEFQLVIKAHDPCPCGSLKQRCVCCFQYNSENVEWKQLILPYISLMMKAACHLGLLLPRSTNSKQQKLKAEAICEQVFAKHRQFLSISRDAAFLALSDPEYCGKMKVLEQLLPKVKARDERVLFFSFRTRLLDIVEGFLRHKGYTFCRLDGSVSSKKRTALVRNFNEDPSIFVFLASKSVGGVGLNIVGANVVIIFDPDWNPAMDLQAQDRAFRLGQSRDVQVYRLVTQGSMEENIYLRQVYKQQMANMALSGDAERRHFTGVQGLSGRQRKGQIKGELFSYENMFTIRQESSCLTEDILKRTSRVENGLLVAKDECAAIADRTEVAEADTTLLRGFSEDEDDCGAGTQKVDSSSDSDFDWPMSVGRQNIAKWQHDAEQSAKKASCALKRQRSAVHFDCSSSDEDSGEFKPRRKQSRRTASREAEAASVNARPSRKGKGVPGKPATQNKTAQGRSSRKRKWDDVDNDVGLGEASEGKLETCGIKCLRPSKSLLGASAAETRMSRHAIRDVFDLHQLSQQPANCLVETSEESDDLGESTRQAQAARSKSKTAYCDSQRKEECKVSTQVMRTQTTAGVVTVSTLRSAKGTTIIGQTPPAIRHQHFTRLARQLNLSTTELGRVVIAAKESERCEWLRQLYSAETPRQQNSREATKEEDRSFGRVTISQDPTVSSSGLSQHCRNQVEVGVVKFVPSSRPSVDEADGSVSAETASQRQSSPCGNILFGEDNAGACSSVSSEEILVEESSMSSRPAVISELDCQSPDLITAVPDSLAVPSSSSVRTDDLKRGVLSQCSQVDSAHCSLQTSASEEQRDLELADLLFG